MQVIEYPTNIGLDIKDIELSHIQEVERYLHIDIVIQQRHQVPGSSCSLVYHIQCVDFILGLVVSWLQNGQYGSQTS